MATITEALIVGALTTSGADVHFRTDVAANVAIEYATKKNFNNSITTLEVTTGSVNDFTGVIALSGFTSDQMYWYRAVVDGVVYDPGYVQKFKTAPSSGTYKFAVFADVANKDRNARVYQEAKNDGVLFSLQIGDMDHRNPNSLSMMRTMHREMRDESKLHGNAFAKHVASKMAVFHIMDDHDYCGNDEDKNCSVKLEAIQAYKEYWPTPVLPGVGLWYSFEVSDAEFFMLDTRTQRASNTDIDNSDKSMLDGNEITNDQKTWLKNGLRDSTAKWKIIVSTITTNDGARPNSNDNWRSFGTEMVEIRDWLIDESIEDAVLITADLHTGGGIDDGTNGGMGIPEITCPHTNLVSGNQNNLGTWSEGVTAGAKGYLLIEVSSTSLVLEVKSHTGAVRHDLTLN